MDDKKLISKKVYLTGLQKKVFKLLPMREDLDNGIDNHLGDFLDSICTGCKGALNTYEDLSCDNNFLDIVNNLQFLSSTDDIPFAKWRKTILRSSRLISDILSEDGQNSCEGDEQ